MANFGIGPFNLLTAVFIGPGTLTACSLVGVGFDSVCFGPYCYPWS